MPSSCATCSPSTVTGFPTTTLPAWRAAPGLAACAPPSACTARERVYLRRWLARPPLRVCTDSICTCARCPGVGTGSNSATPLKSLMYTCKYSGTGALPPAHPSKPVCGLCVDDGER
eukprot:2049622-Pleurochrysis_carterae.AAC.1